MKIASVADVKAQFSAYLETARQQISEGAGIGHEDFWKEMETKKPGRGRSKGSGKTA